MDVPVALRLVAILGNIEVHRPVYRAEMQRHAQTLCHVEHIGNVEGDILILVGKCPRTILVNGAARRSFQLLCCIGHLIGRFKLLVRVIFKRYSVELNRLR